MHQLGEAQHEHWSGQGVLEHLCAETQRRGASNESKAAADPFSKLLASFETQELLPTLHPSSVLTPSKRQRKSYRPSRVPPAHEILLPMHGKQSQTAPSEGARMDQSALIEQHPPASLRAYNTTTLSDTQEGKKLNPPSTNMKDFPGAAKLLQNGMSTLNLSLPTSLNPEKFITGQKNGWNFKSLLPTDDKLSSIIENNASESFTYLLNLQQNEKNLDSLCSTVCRNVACQAQISLEASFCRRCSCCICKLFDGQKDPSLWILCDPVANGGCGLSCHIECALKQQIAGVVTTTNGSIPALDGSYFCQSCGAITPLIGCWKEQLSAAKDARTFDIFQYRLLLSYRLLKGTNRHRDVHGPIEQAVKKVDAELSQLATGSLQRLRCNENMLSCKEEVQRLINLALEKADTRGLASGATKHAGHSMAPCMVCFEDVSSSSIVVTVNDVETFMKPELLGYKLWHRRASEPMYACTPTSIQYNIHDKFVVSNLLPLTDYTFKVVPFSKEGDLVVCEAGCSTKGAEHVESPVDVYASLDVVLINTKLVGEGTSRCMNQVFNLDYHIDKPKNGPKIQDLEEVLPDQNEQAHHVSSVSPSSRKEQKDNCEGISSPYAKTGANARHGRENLVHSNIAAAQQDRKLHSLVASGPSKHKQACTGSANLSMRKSSCVSLDCQEDKLLMESRHCNSELKTTNKQEFCYGTSSTEKASTTKVLKCERPSQRWGMQAHGSDNTIAASTQSDRGIVQGADNHMQGTVACNGEVEFSNYEFSVKVIRWLECQGHLKEEFRMKFLTWYTLRASEHEKRVVSVFIDTLQDDPASLGGQLVDAFEDIIETKRQPTTPDGYCRRLW